MLLRNLRDEGQFLTHNSEGLELLLGFFEFQEDPEDLFDSEWLLLAAQQLADGSYELLHSGDCLHHFVQFLDRLDQHYGVGLDLQDSSHFLQRHHCVRAPTQLLGSSLYML